MEAAKAQEDLMNLYCNFDQNLLDTNVYVDNIQSDYPSGSKGTVEVDAGVQYNVLPIVTDTVVRDQVVQLYKQ